MNLNASSARLTKINHTKGDLLYRFNIVQPIFYTYLVTYCIFRNSVRLAIRKIMYAPSKQGEQPSVEVSKEFIMSPNKLHLEASLDKELYYHGETIAVNVHIQNNSNKSVKKVKVSGNSLVVSCM